MRQLLFLIVVVSVASVFGCSKKETTPVTIQEAATPQAAELPALEQNINYQTNQPDWAKNPDTSFTDSPDHLEKPSEEDELFAKPASD